MTTVEDRAAALERLRDAMRREDVQALLVPSGDAHCSEYVAKCDERRGFISGFTGSMGDAVVGLEAAAVWVDGRYYLQADKEVDHSRWQVQKKDAPMINHIVEWVLAALPPKGALGVDGSLLSLDEQTHYSKALQSKGFHLKLLEKNLVDEIWTTRPAAPPAPIFPLPLKFAGQRWEEKVANLRVQLAKQNLFAYIVCPLDEIAWLYNLRGGDIEYTPVFFSYSIVTMDECHLFLNEKKITDEVRQHLGSGVKLHPFDQFFPFLTSLAKTLNEKKKSIGVHPDTATARVGQAAPHAIAVESSPIQLAKALKNETEQEGMRQSHLRDGVAVVEFLCWLENELNLSPPPHLTEYSISEKLAEFRARDSLFHSLSFDTIAGSGPNGAIIHYKPKEKDCAAVRKDLMLLLDSGGQYKDGTTDITRTVHFGTPTEEERRSYTLVLRGHIGLDRAVFPEGTPGSTLDVLARTPLWSYGLDYRHGTGHGVGSFLGVHEGPQSMNQRPARRAPVPLQP
jgi:Xaa-Pro aminopeptidase